MPCEDHGVCITTALEVADRICSEKQLKFTKLRKNILRMIWEDHVPQKAYDLLDKLQTTNHSAKPALAALTLQIMRNATS
jgi:Fur family zinc uptake transcriptional regulator